MDYPKASDLMKLAEQKANEKVEKCFHGMEDHIKDRMLEEATKGSTSYTFYANKIEHYCLSKELYDRFVKIGEELEESGYKVLIFDTGNEYWSNFAVKISWSGEIPKAPTGFGFENIKVLYSGKGDN